LNSLECDPPFDGLIDDVFMSCNKEPVKVTGYPDRWIEPINRVLSPGGILVSNSLESLDHVPRAFFSQGYRGYRLLLEEYENEIIVASRNESRLKTLPQSMQKHPWYKKDMIRALPLVT
jgi:hypothetical protein